MSAVRFRLLAPTYGEIMKRTRAERRHYAQKAKDKTRRILKGWSWSGEGEPTELRVAKMSQTHCVNCSCYMCGNPRKYYDDITIQEKKAKEDYEEQSRLAKE